MNEIGKFFSIKENQILNSIPLSILFWAVSGTYFSYITDLTFNKDVWFWFFSTIAQTFAAVVAFIAMFYIYQMDSLNFQTNLYFQLVSKTDDEKDRENFAENLNSDRDRFKSRTRDLLLNTIPIIIISIILIPFGSIKMEETSIFIVLNTYKLNLIIIFGTIGYCISSLYKITKKIVF